MNIPLVLLGFSRVFESMVSRFAEFSVAGRDLHVANALLALDVATPVELALAPFRPSFPSSRVASVAAQQVAPVDAFRLRVALAALGAKASFLHVQLAVVGAGHEVDQVDVPVVLVPVELRHQHSSTASPLLLHFVCSVELLL